MIPKKNYGRTFLKDFNKLGVSGGVLKSSSEESINPEIHFYIFEKFLEETPQRYVFREDILKYTLKESLEIFYTNPQRSLLK